jgi:hypothetical protein
VALRAFSFIGFRNGEDENLKIFPAILALIFVDGHTPSLLSQYLYPLGV